MTTRFIVLRNCLPPLAEYEGRWYEIEVGLIGSNLPIDYRNKIAFGRTRRFETREDGERAEVFEPCEPVT